MVTCTFKSLSLFVLHKTHHLHGLGLAFATYLHAQINKQPLPDFRKVKSGASTFDTFQRSIEDSSPTFVAYMAAATSLPPTSFNNNRQQPSRGGRSH